MIVHVLQTHARDSWCIEFHLRTYLEFCDVVVVAVDSSPSMTQAIEAMDSRINAFDFDGNDHVPLGRVDEWGVLYHEREIRQASLDEAMKLNPSLLVFGDTDEVPTPDVTQWIAGIAARPQAGERFYCHWVNLFGDYAHAIGGMSAWSFQNPRGNKKCLAMQPGGEMRYDGSRHTGMEPGRAHGGEAPTGEGRYLIETPLLVHLKYASEAYRSRPESKLARHSPDEMLKNGEVVDVPMGWLWDGMPA